jgi:hypothetical protein
MELETIIFQLVGAAWTVFLGLAVNYMKTSSKTRKEISDSLKRLEILFDAKIPQIEKKLEDHDERIISLMSKINRR